MAGTEIKVKPASAVFIDVPNICGGRNNHWLTMNWKRLSQAIAASEVLVDTDLILANAYVGNWEQGQQMVDWAKVAFKTFAGTAFQMNIRTYDDVDSLIIEDMWSVVACHEQESIKDNRLTYPLQVRFVLVSGDSDYLRTIHKLREAYGTNLELEIIVYSWIKSLSGDLQDAANKCIYLDTLKGFKEHAA